MVETSHDIRRELEITRTRMGETLSALEYKMNPKHVVDNYPLAAAGVAFGLGVLAGSVLLENTLPQRASPEHSARDDGSNANTVDALTQSVSAALVTAGAAKLGEFLDALTHSSSRSSARRLPRVA